MAFNLLSWFSQAASKVGGFVSTTGGAAAVAGGAGALAGGLVVGSIVHRVTRRSVECAMRNIKSDADFKQLNDQFLGVLRQVTSGNPDAEMFYQAVHSRPDLLFREVGKASDDDESMTNAHIDDLQEAYLARGLAGDVP